LSLIPKDNDLHPPAPAIGAATGQHPSYSDPSRATRFQRDIALGFHLARQSRSRRTLEETHEQDSDFVESHDDNDTDSSNEDDRNSRSEERRSNQEHHNQSQESTIPEVLESDVKLMDLYTVHEAERAVEATITSDGDSITVTGTDITDVTASIISSRSDVGSVTFHSALSKHRMHTNTRYSIVGDRGEFDMRLYGKKCRAAALTKFRNLELFRVSNRSVSFIVSVYILHEAIPQFPCFYEDWVTILCCALNVARMQPYLFSHYQGLSNKRKGLYREAVAAMLPFECLRGTNQKKAVVKDTVTDIPHATGSDYISVFWDVIKCWALLPEELAQDDMDTLMDTYNLASMLGGSVNSTRTTLGVLPIFARYMTKDAIFSARAVGIKSAWQSKPCSLVIMNDKESIRDVFVAHTAEVHKQVKKIITHVPAPRREIIVGVDVGHHIAPTSDHTSFLCHGYGMARFAKDATTRTKHDEKIWREDNSNSAGELASVVSSFLQFCLKHGIPLFHFLFSRCVCRQLLFWLGSFSPLSSRCRA
jgi:hypothetical protein